MLVGVTVTVAFLVNAFRFFTPNEVFPVAYRQGKTAHLDVGGRRGEAIRHAVQDQLGLTVVEVEPFGLAGSGGSTPLRICVAGDPDTYLFGKLYAMSHVRADRWYKLGRTLLYGRLEDEAPFQSVARLVEYEDYTLRVMRDSGIPTAEPYGIVELTPSREYLLVTEFFDGAHRDRRRRGHRRDHRRRARAHPQALGLRARAPRHQAGEPARAQRAPPAHRRRLRAGATLTVASGRRPRQHDAGARGAHRSGARVRAGAAVLHPRRDRRGVRRGAWCRQPDPAAHGR